MTSPRYIRPCFTYLVTRRCTQRQFLLRPGKETNELIAYLLAYCATKYGIRLHAYCFLANHYHVMLTDPREEISNFLRDFHSLVTRVLNSRYGRTESIWPSVKQTSLVRPIESEDVFDKMLYTICNPVSHRLVPDSKQWPGLRSRPADIGTVRIVKRPRDFFQEDGPTTETAELELEPPPDSGTAEEFREQLRQAVAERENEIRIDVVAQGQTFLGRKRVLKQHHEQRPMSPETPGELNPHIACKNKVRRQEEISIWKRFVADYREALALFISGVRDVVFPPGTYRLRKFYGLRCAQPP